MPAVTFNLYDKFMEGQHDGNAVDFETPGGNGIKMALVTNTYTPNVAHDFFDDITNQVTGGTSYTAGGNVMSSGAVSVSAGTVTVDLANPATWSLDASGPEDIRRAIVYLDTGTASTSRLIGYSDAFAADQSLRDGDVTITVHDDGLFTTT